MVISQAEAQNFCLVAAQIVPTLLIAIFVADRTLPTVSSGKRQAKIAKWTRISEKGHEALKTGRQDLIERQERLFKIDPDDMSPEGVNAYRAEQDEFEWKAEWIEKLTRKLGEADESLRAAADEPLITAWYRSSLANLLFAGLAAETFAIAGALGFQRFGYQAPVLLSAGSIVGMLGLMTQSAWLRLFPESRENLSGFIGPTIISIFGFFALLIIWIAVYGNGPAVKTVPRRIPAPHASITQSSPANRAIIATPSSLNSTGRTR